MPNSTRPTKAQDSIRLARRTVSEPRVFAAGLRWEWVRRACLLLISGSPGRHRGCLPRPEHTLVNLPGGVGHGVNAERIAPARPGRLAHSRPLGGGAGK